MLFAQAGLLFFGMTVLSGVIYPVAVTGFAQLLWPTQSQGSVISQEGVVIGSALIAQDFSSANYFWPRPSSSNFSALPAAASNLGPTSKEEKNLIDLRRQKLATDHHVSPMLVPEILLTSSGSGLDPHISLQATLFQVARVSQARGLDAQGQEQLKDLVTKSLEKPQLGLLGQARINVLLLNLSLDRTFRVK